MGDEKRRYDDDIELGEKDGKSFSPPRPITPSPRYTPAVPSSVTNNAVLPVLSYCVSSILMTVTNKYVLSGTGFNLNFFLLAVQVGSVRLPTSIWC